MNSHGILFKTEMVRALLNTKVGVWPAEAIDTNKPWKWQTRRLPDEQPEIFDGPDNWLWKGGARLKRAGYASGYVHTNLSHVLIAMVAAAKYQVGDEIFCKETFHAEDKLSVVYRADESGSGPSVSDTFSKGWTPSIFMPRWASRITLEVMAVRCERLQDISADDCISEGINFSEHKCGCERCAFTSELCPATQSSLILAYRELWNSINGADSWDKNPFVFVYEFRRVK